MQLLTILILALVMPQLAIAQPPASYYPLTIQVSPLDSKVLIKNIKAKYKLGMMLAPGKYNVIVSHPQYGKQQQWVEIKDTAVIVQVVLDKPAPQQLPQSVAFTPSVIPTPIKPPEPVSVKTAPTPPAVVATPNNPTIASPKPTTNSVVVPVHSNTEVDWSHFLSLYSLMSAIAGIILLLFLWSTYKLVHFGEVDIYLNLPQPLLFCVLYYLIYVQLGPQHYQFDHPPQWWDWVQFTGAHILRAGDILDVIEEYKWNLQNIKHASSLVANTVIAMHWIVDVFLLGWVWERMVGHTFDEEWAFALSLIAFLALIVYLIGMTVYAFLDLIPHYIGNLYLLTLWVLFNEFVLWPLDNLIRVVDVGDTFQLYNIKLYDTHFESNSFLEIAFRLGIGYIFGYVMSVYYAYIFGGMGSSIDEIVRLSKHSSISDAHLARLSKLGVKALPGLLEVFMTVDESKERTVVNILGQIDPHWRKRKEVESIVTNLISGLEEKGQSAFYEESLAHKLTYLGSSAQTAIPSLIRNATAFFEGRSNKTREVLLDVLRQIDSSWYKREEAKFAILDICNYVLLMPLTSSDAAKTAKIYGQILIQMGIAETVIPKLINVLKDKNSKPFDKMIACKALGTWKVTAAIPVLMHALAYKDGTTPESAAIALGQMGPIAAVAIPALLQMQKYDGSTPDVYKIEATRALDKIDPQWRSKYKTDA